MGDTLMGTPKGKGRRAGAKIGTAEKPKKEKLTLRVTREERRKLRTYAADHEMTVSALVIRMAEKQMVGWFTVQRGELPRLAPGTDTSSAAGAALAATEVRAVI
jgi:hypothetical protein